jgi:hypothetical protein
MLRCNAMQGFVGNGKWHRGCFERQPMQVRWVIYDWLMNHQKYGNCQLELGFHRQKRIAQNPWYVE